MTSLMYTVRGIRQYSMQRRDSYEYHSHVSFLVPRLFEKNFFLDSFETVPLFFGSWSEDVWIIFFIFLRLFYRFFHNLNLGSAVAQW